MNSSELEALVERIAEQTARKMARYESPVLTIEDAMTITGHRTKRAFSDWRRRMKISPCGFERYPLGAIRRGLEREAKQKLRTNNKRHLA